MDDLIERAKRPASMMLPSERNSLVPELTAALSEAQAEIARLREALRQIAVMGFDDDDKVARRIGELAVVQARAALLPREGGG